MNCVTIDLAEDDEKKLFISNIYYDIYDELLMYLKKNCVYESLIEDIINETFLESVRKKNELFVHPNPKGWIFNTLKFKALKMCSSYSKRMQQENSVDDERYTFLNVQKYNELSYETLLFEDWISRILNKEEIKLVMQYCYYGYTSGEIAACHNENSAAVRMRYSRIIKRLKTYCIKHDII